jgi:hypothetical protein
LTTPLAVAAPSGVQPATSQVAAADGPVVVGETETSTTYENPDGTMTLQAAAAPIHVRRDGTWVDVDTDLAESGGVVAPKASAADVSFSAGGSGPVATLASGSMVYSLDWLSGLPTPTISGDTATYADVAPGIDLVLRASRLGYEQFFVIRRRPTKPVGTLRLPVHLSGGLALSQEDDGTLQLRDADGTLVAQAAAPRMWDATTDPHTGNPTHSAPVDVQLVTNSSGGQELDVTPTEGFLDDPAVTYPVTVDPSANLTRQGDTWVQSSIHNTPQAGSTELRAGTYDGGTTVARSYIDFAIAPVMGEKIDSATLKLYDFHSWSCAAAPVNIDPLASGFDGTTTWDNKPGRVTGYRVSKSFAHGYSADCPASYASLDVTSIMRAWASSTITDYGLMVSASETDSAGWKKFNSANAADNVPLMLVDYEDCGTYSGYQVCGPILTK